MADTETGFKWWMRYVIVPLIGGGGIIAIVVAMLSAPPKQKDDQPQTVPANQATLSAPAPFQTPAAMTHIEKIPAPKQPLVKQQAIQKLTPEPVKTPASIEKTTEYEPDLKSIKFYIYDRTEHTSITEEVPANVIVQEFPYGEKFAVDWEAKSVVSHLNVEVFLTENSGPTEQIGYGVHEGTHNYTCRDVDGSNLDFEMILKLEDGTKRRLKKIQVLCGAK